MAKSFNVLIIGAGQIGASFDSPKSRKILTHAHAFLKHPGFNLLGFFDTDFRKAETKAKIWGVSFFKSLDEAFNKNEIDIVCVAVPDSAHYLVLKEIVKYKPKFVFSEKPLTTSIPSSQEILKLYQKYRVPLLINYSRRFVPEFIHLRNEIKQRKYGKFLGGIGYYGKGILHNGSHLIDFLRFCVGEIDSFKNIEVEKGPEKKDPQISTVLYIKNKAFFLKNINYRNFTIFEIDLLFEKARFRIKDLGFSLETYKVKNNPIYKGYKNIVESNTIKTTCVNSMFFATKHIYNFLNRKTKLLCPAEEALKDLKVCLKISKNA